MQCTVHVPAVGTREYEPTYAAGRVIDRVGTYRVSERDLDANHVVVLQAGAAWKRQLQLLGGYAAFYNPVNAVRALRRDSRLRKRRFGYQIVGLLATVWTACKIVPYALRLARGRIRYHTEPPPQRSVDVVHPQGAFARYPAVTPTVSPPGEASALSA
jgi:hypothetical protein